MESFLKVREESENENYHLLSLVTQFTRNGMEQKFPYAVIGSTSNSYSKELIILH